MVELEHEVAEMKRKVEHEESVTASAVAAAASAAEAAANEASRTHGTPTLFGLKLNKQEFHNAYLKSIRHACLKAPEKLFY